jgi:hypothetical protein
MSTFYGSPSHMLAAVADAVAAVETDTVNVHTITLVLNGAHGEFDLTIEASDEDCEPVVFTAIAHRSGGITGFGMVTTV